MDRLGKGVVHDDGSVLSPPTAGRLFLFAISLIRYPFIFFLCIRLFKEAIHIAEGIIEKVFLLLDYTLFYI